MAKKPNQYDVRPRTGGFQYNVYGVDEQGTLKSADPAHEKAIRGLINAMSVNSAPKSVVVLPDHVYDNMRSQIQAGHLGNQQIQRNATQEENWGGGTKLGDGFSIPTTKQVFLRQSLMKNQDDLQGVLAHELGHMSALDNGDMSERGADNFSDVYTRRGQDTMKTWNGIQKLPVRSNLGASLTQPQPSAPSTMTAALSGQGPNEQINSTPGGIAGR